MSKLFPPKNARSLPSKISIKSCILVGMTYRSGQVPSQAYIIKDFILLTQLFLGQNDLPL